MLLENLRFKILIMKTYKCLICGFLYNPEQGDPAGGIEPGIEFADLPEDYICPICGAGKDEFVEDE